MVCSTCPRWRRETLGGNDGGDEQEKAGGLDHVRICGRGGQGSWFYVQTHPIILFSLPHQPHPPAFQQPSSIVTQRSAQLLLRHEPFDIRSSRRPLLPRCPCQGDYQKISDGGWSIWKPSLQRRCRSIVH